MLELDNFLPQVALTLDAQPAALLIQQFAIELCRQAAGSCHHVVESGDAIPCARQRHKNSSRPESGPS